MSKERQAISHCWYFSAVPRQGLVYILIPEDACIFIANLCDLGLRIYDVQVYIQRLVW